MSNAGVVLLAPDELLHTSQDLLALANVFDRGVGGRVDGGGFGLTIVRRIWR